MEEVARFFEVGEELADECCLAFAADYLVGFDVGVDLLDLRCEQVLEVGALGAVYVAEESGALQQEQHDFAQAGDDGAHGVGAAVAHGVAEPALKKIQVQSNSYDFATRLIPVGKDGLMLNVDGKNYIENYQYSKKVKTMTWKDERYTDVESLKEDAEAKLDEISKPYKSYTADVVNLAEQSEEHKEVFSIALGDTVLLISKSTGIRESHRIVKFYEYPQTREKNKVELANTRLSFEEVQRTEQEL